MRVLILGGTGDANRLATAIAQQGIDAVYSYAGRTSVPVPQPLPVRTGGFGGVDGLTAFLLTQSITHVIDATHPFAAEMSAHAVAACKAAGVPLLALERPPWQAGLEDHWIEVPDLNAAVAALPDQPARVFLAIGRQHLTPFAAKPQHAYTLRFVDDPAGDIPLAEADVIVARGPFNIAGETDLITSRSIQWIVTRNSGGDGAYAKIVASRLLGTSVIMIGRPALPDRPSVPTVEQSLAWLAHATRLGA